MHAMMTQGIRRIGWRFSDHRAGVRENSAMVSDNEDGGSLLSHKGFGKG